MTDDAEKKARNREAELDQFRKLRDTGSPALRDELVEQFAWVARHGARRFRDRGEPWDDLYQVAMIGVVKAVDRFDPEYGASFVSFALTTVLGELRRHFRDTTWAVRVPRRLKDLHVQVGSTVAFLSEEFNRPPTPDEIAEHLDIEVDDVLEALDAGAAYRSTPLNVTGERGDDDAAPAGVLLGGEDPQLDRADDRLLLGDALNALPEREREILKLRFVDGLSQSEIGDLVGVSQVHVSRLLRKSIRALQEELGQREP